jgi:hypothetical protein
MDIANSGEQQTEKQKEVLVRTNSDEENGKKMEGTPKNKQQMNIKEEMQKWKWDYEQSGSGTRGSKRKVS